MNAILYFDTSTVAAGVLLEDGKPMPRLVALKRLIYETREGDADIAALFDAAEAWRREHPGGLVAVACEGIYTGGGFSAKGRAVHDAFERRKGQLQLHARERQLAWGGEIAPGTAKLALTGKGNAGKQRMVQFANSRFRDDLLRLRGRLLEYTGDSRTCSEHEADAIGGAMAALHGRYIKTAAAKRAERKAEKERLASLAGGAIVAVKKTRTPKAPATGHSAEFQRHVADFRRRERAARGEPEMVQGRLGL